MGVGQEGGRPRRKEISVCIELIHSVVQQTLTQHYKATILQFKKRMRSRRVAP